MEVQKLSSAYVAQTAKNYDSDRTKQKKWKVEQDVMHDLLQKLPEGSDLVDIPAGTGRFFGFYQERKLDVLAYDISEDMLDEAKLRAADENLDTVQFKVGDILNIPLKDAAVKTSVCIRFLNWVDWPFVEKAFSEIHRVSNEYIIMGVRHRVPWATLLFPVPQLKKIYRRMRLNARMLIKPKVNELVYHRKNNIDRLFDKNNVDILDRRCIEERNDGTDYYFYLLRKKS